MKKFEKPVVPQYVADWYEENKDNFEDNLAYLLNDYLIKNFAFIEDSNLKEWLDKDFNQNKPIQTLVNMHQFGYEVEPEKEKLYIVKIPNSNGSNTYFTKDENGKVGLSNVYWDSLTEEEIKEENEWAWKYAKEVKDN